MARGFWTGLLHGGVLGAAGLVLLSLAVPLPRTGQGPVTGVADPAVPMSRQTLPDPSVPAPDALSSNAPTAGAVDLPVGSEFGRGGDIAPQVPISIADDRSDIGDAPAVVTPTSEPAPVAVTAADPRPQPAGDGNGPVQIAPAAGEDAPNLARPIDLSGPSLSAPARAGSVAPDVVPDTAPDVAPIFADEASLARRPQADRLTEPLPDSDSVDDSHRNSASDPARAGDLPRQAAPAIDLSLPPDLTELQNLSQ